MPNVIQDAEAVLVKTWWPAWATKQVLIIIGLAIVAIVALYIGYKVFIAPANAKHDIAEAQGTTAVAQGAAQAGAQTVHIVVDNQTHAGQIDQQSEKNRVYITKQPGASDPVNPAVYDAFVHSVCMRASAASLPECDGVRQTNP